MNVEERRETALVERAFAAPTRTTSKILLRSSDNAYMRRVRSILEDIGRGRPARELRCKALGALGFVQEFRFVPNSSTKGKGFIQPFRWESPSYHGGLIGYGCAS
jgi:hypothetical protein